MPERFRTSRNPLLPVILIALLLSVAAIVTSQESTPEAAEATAEFTEAPPESTPEVTAETPFPVANDLTIAALRELTIEGSDILIEQTLENGANYTRYIASYISEGNKIYGLLTIPFGDVPLGGFKAVVFNHGYIPPDQYRTTERYIAYVDMLARSGLVVFKIDLRGHGDSEGEPMGSYFSPAYTIDAITALRSLQRMDIIDPEGIGMWGHSMAGNLVLRAMLVEPDIQAGVIWAGAVYSYDDFVKYAISDTSFVRRPDSPGLRRSRAIFDTYGQPNTAEPFWQAVSLTHNIEYLQKPVQLHHAVDDDVVNIGYSRDLADVLLTSGKTYEFYEYDSGGHNIGSPSFDQAMSRTIAFFQQYL